MIIKLRIRIANTTSGQSDLRDFHFSRCFRLVLIGTLFAILIALPRSRAACDESGAPVDAKATAQAPKADEANSDGELDLASNNGQFELLVLGPDGKPVSDASVEIYGKPTPAADDLLKGTVVKKTKNTLQAKTDAHGRLVVKLAGQFTLNITTSGYGPYWASWLNEGNPQNIPARFTAELEAAWSVGSIVVDDAGKPVEGAVIYSSIKLQPWAKVNGAFRIGKTPCANVPITIDADAFRSGDRSTGSVYAQYDTTTGKDGLFAFDRMVPGKARISRRVVIMVDQGSVEATSTPQLTMDFPLRETTQIDLGGIGQPVIGKLQPFEGFKGQAEWQFATAHLSSKMPLPLEPHKPQVPANIKDDKEKRTEWLAKWKQTEEGKAWWTWTRAVKELQKIEKSGPSFLATIKRDGTFRIENVPSGSYTLRVGFSRNSAGALADFRFFVPSIDGESSDTEHDLGEIPLQK